MGSIRTARRAGTKHAAIATSIRTRATLLTKRKSKSPPCLAQYAGQGRGLDARMTAFKALFGWMQHTEAVAAVRPDQH